MSQSELVDLYAHHRTTPLYEKRLLEYSTFASPPALQEAEKNILRAFKELLPGGGTALGIRMAMGLPKNGKDGLQATSFAEGQLYFYPALVGNLTYHEVRTPARQRQHVFFFRVSRAS